MQSKIGVHIIHRRVLYTGKYGMLKVMNVLGDTFMGLGQTQTSMNLYWYEICATVYMKPGQKCLVPGFRMIEVIYIFSYKYIADPKAYRPA